MRILRLHLSNFLSYRNAELDLGDLVALVGPNAAGKSNTVAAIRLLREIPTYGLQTALARRGGFDQLRHRSHGRPYDPSVAIEFRLGNGDPISRYELHLGSKAGKRYEVKLEKAEIWTATDHVSFRHVRGKIELQTNGAEARTDELPDVPVAQSAMPAVLPWIYPAWGLLTALQTVEINPARVADLQEPSATNEFEPDGSNTASFLEMLTTAERRELVDQLSAVVPGISRVEPRHVGDKLTMTFYQTVAGKSREFSAKQMSDGTLRILGVLLALFQSRPPALVVIEEPEVAIHLGALRTLVEILTAHSDTTQILITTHSADIVDALDVSQLRVVWNEGGASHIARVAEHTQVPIQQGLTTPGELLRSDALDPA